MVKTFFSMLLLFYFVTTYASEASPSSFCAKKDYLDQLQYEQNHLSFLNSGGLLNSGVCWWHSRFTRNALYLVEWRADLPRLGREAAKKIISQIRRGLKVVTVPGYDNLLSFSHDFSDLIQRELENWQITDGVLKNKWVDGLLGTPFMPARLLSRYMDFLYQQVNRTDDVLFLRVQLQGVSAHAWLLKSMKKTNDGYRFEVLDSNFKGMKEFDYKRGSTSMKYFSTKFIPYLQFTPDLVKIKSVGKWHCKK